MGIVESGQCDTAFNSVSMSSVKDVKVGAGINVVEVHGVVGADGQGVGASVGKEGGVCPGVVRGRDLVNLAYTLSKIQAVIIMRKMITVVVMVDGRCRFMKLHELSTDVEFWIWSATSFVGVGGGREALHMLGVWQVGCQ